MFYRNLVRLFNFEHVVRPPQKRRNLRRRITVESLEERVLLTQGPLQISTYVASSPINISNQSINYVQFVSGASVAITSGLVPSEDRLSFNNPTGAAITGTYNSATGILTLSGNASGTNYAAVLNSVQYSNIAANPSNGDRGFTVQIGKPVYFSGTDHYYEYVALSSQSWTSAQSIASSRNNLGLTGYLATITSQAEQDFIYNTFGGSSGWIGANDSATYDNWRWRTGPEGQQSGGSGLQFWQGNSTGGPVSGQYNKWFTGYPYSSSTANYVAMHVDGKWYNAENSSTVSGFFVEYGGLGSTPSFYDRWSGTIHVLDRTDSPIVTSPATATTVFEANSYSILGTAAKNSLVSVYVDADNNGIPDTPNTSVASQQLSSSATSFSISTTLTQNANNFVVLATAYPGANPSNPLDVPTITNLVNHAPTGVNLTNSTLPENAGLNALIGTFSGVDADAGNTFTYTLVTGTGTGSTDNASFTIDGTELKTAASFDYETKSSYSIRVLTTDQGGLTFEKQFAITVQNVTELNGIDVQNGQTQRSYVRYLDLAFDQSSDLMGLIDNNRIKLTKSDLNGGSPNLVSIGTPSVNGNNIKLDFGINGLGGNRNTNAGDGYYEIAMDLDGNGSFETKKYFYRLLGDVNGDRKVDTTDSSLVTSAFGSTSAERDVNGDGIVNANDRTLVLRGVGRMLKIDLFTDD